MQTSIASGIATIELGNLSSAGEKRELSFILYEKARRGRDSEPKPKSKPTNARDEAALASFLQLDAH